MHGKPSQLHNALSSKAKQYEREVGHGYCSYSLLACCKLGCKQRRPAVRRRRQPYVFPLDIVIANNCVGERVPATLRCFRKVVVVSELAPPDVLKTRV